MSEEQAPQLTPEQAQRVDEREVFSRVIEAFGCRGGLMMLVMPDGAVHVTGGAKDDMTREILTQIKITMGQLATEASAILQGKMPCSGCAGTGKIPQTNAICLGCMGRKWIDRPQSAIVAG